MYTIYANKLEESNLTASKSEIDPVLVRAYQLEWYLDRSPIACHSRGIITILYSRSVDPQKLRVGVKYCIVHMYSMPYYTYSSTANFLFLEPTALIFIIYNIIYLASGSEPPLSVELSELSLY